MFLQGICDSHEAVGGSGVGSCTGTWRTARLHRPRFNPAGLKPDGIKRLGRSASAAVKDRKEGSCVLIPPESGLRPGNGPLG